MDETWLKELNQRNLELEGQDSSKRDCVTVSVSSSVLNKLSEAEQGKFRELRQNSGFVPFPLCTLVPFLGRRYRDSAAKEGRPTHAR